MSILYMCPKCGCAMESPDAVLLPTRLQLLERNARLVALLKSAGHLLTGAQAADASIEQAWGEELDAWCKERNAALAENGVQ